jgi:hypothetical protein
MSVKRPSVRSRSGLPDCSAPDDTASPLLPSADQCPALIQESEDPATFGWFGEELLGHGGDGVPEGARLLHLGIRTKQAITYLELPVWDRNRSLVDEDGLAGRMATTSDLCALCWTFPDGVGGFDVQVPAGM